MLPYDEVRAKLGGIELPYRELREIPLDAIVGTVSRYNDFSRSLLPLKENDGVRWANVKTANETLEGLPPIEVYQVGEAYFILDGHHRASVARDLGATTIQAYVRQVRTKVQLSPTDEVEDIILKAELTEFLQKTHLDELRPESDLRLSSPGGYEKLLEHISVHRYYQGINENRPVPYEEAVAHWFDTVYLPVAREIRRHSILKYFPNRTEADLYLWTMDHRASLEEELGWKVNPQTAARDLAERYSSNWRRIGHLIRQLVEKISPVEIEPGPPPGEWRRQRVQTGESLSLFGNILVSVPGDHDSWGSVDTALQIATMESSFVGGLYVLPHPSKANPENIEKLKNEFTRRCSENDVDGNLAVEYGKVSRVLLKRAEWADLLVLRLRFPPPMSFLPRLRSGLRNLIRLSPIPLLLYPPGAATSIHSVCLAYGGGAHADEALFLTTYLVSRFGFPLTVVTADRGRPRDNDLPRRAKGYLEDFGISDADMCHQAGDPAQLILQRTEAWRDGLIVMGGYESKFIREFLTGSTVDRVLERTRLPVLICR